MVCQCKLFCHFFFSLPILFSSKAHKWGKKKSCDIHCEKKKKKKRKEKKQERKKMRKKAHTSWGWLLL